MSQFQDETKFTKWSEDLESMQLCQQNVYGIIGLQQNSQEWYDFGKNQLKIEHLQCNHFFFSKKWSIDWFRLRLQFVQLLLCDWLLETRTSCWEMEQSSKEYPANDDNNNQVLCNPLPSKELEQFQADLNSLHCIVDYIPVNTYKTNNLNLMFLKFSWRICANYYLWISISDG